MKKALAVLCFAVLAPMVVPAAAQAQVHACDAADDFCIRHCLAYHRGLDRVVCLITHNIAT